MNFDPCHIQANILNCASIADSGTFDVKWLRATNNIIHVRKEPQAAELPSRAVCLTTQCCTKSLVQ